MAMSLLEEGIAANAPVMLLSGPSGIGKTLLLNVIQSRHMSTRVIGWIRLNDEIDTPPETGTEYEVSSEEFIASIKELLDEASQLDQPALLIVDDAHLLSAEDLKELRRLQQLSRNTSPPLSLLLAAGTASAPLRALTRDAGAAVVLPPLAEDEVTEYVEHRFARRNCDCHRGISPFFPESLHLLHQLSDGVPGEINRLAQRCLDGADWLGIRRINAALAERCLRQGPEREPLVLPVKVGTPVEAPVPGPTEGPAETIAEAESPRDLLRASPAAPPLVTAEKAAPGRRRPMGRYLAMAGAATIALTAAVLLRNPTTDNTAIVAATPDPLPAATVEEPVAAPVEAPVDAPVAVPVSVPEVSVAQAHLETGFSTVPDARAVLNEALEAGLSDPSRAALLYERAAIWNNARAAYYLGQMFEAGDGVGVDTYRARAWYLAAGSIPGAAMRLESIEDNPAIADGQIAAPVPVAQTLLPTGQLELHWRSGAGRSADGFAVEYVPAGGTDAVARVETDRSAILLDGPVERWRIIALDGVGGPAGQTDWFTPAPANP